MHFRKKISALEDFTYQLLNAIRPEEKCVGRFQTYPRSLNVSQVNKTVVCATKRQRLTCQVGLLMRRQSSEEMGLLNYGMQSHLFSHDDLRACHRRCPEPEFRAIGLFSASSPSGNQDRHTLRPLRTRIFRTNSSILLPFSRGAEKRK